MRTHRRHDNGYALLIVLTVLAVSSSVLAIAARRAAREASETAFAHRELQVRWGCASLEYALLPEASAILADAESRQKQPRSDVGGDVTLGGMVFRVLLADEGAKANVNALRRQGDDQALLRSLDRLQVDAPQRLAVRLRPRAEPDITNPSLPAWYQSLDQLFDMDRPDVSSGAKADCLILRRVTCWGSGQVNLHRADLAVIKEVLGRHVNPAQLALLDALRQSGKPFSAGQALLRMQMTTDRINAVLPLVTDVSRCYSMRIRVDDGLRQRRRLYVRQQATLGRRAQFWSLEW